MTTITNENILQNVQTYQPAQLAFMLNSFVGISISNKKFKGFNDLEANLGQSVTFDLAPRMRTQNGLVVNLQASQQRVQTLSCTQALNSSIAFNAQQFMFNVEDYMERFGKAQILEIGSEIERDFLKVITGSMTVSDPENPDFGSLVDPASGPYRFYGSSSNGTVAPINSSGQLAQAVANFKDYGAAKDNLCAILPEAYIPAIINTNANQFTVDRGNEETYSWNLGKFTGCDWYTSNLLPQHEAGNVGNATGGDNVLTLVSTNDPTGQNITQLTFSGWTANDPTAVVVGDRLEFVFGVGGGIPDVYYRQFIGHGVSRQPVQVRSVANSGSNGSGNITVTIYPALVSVPNQNQNLSRSLVPGMQVSIMPSHQVGVLMSGNPMYLAMPKMPPIIGFPSVNTMDPDSGASIRNYWGTQIGQNVNMYVYDQMYGGTFVAENGMALCFPLRP